jgi:hypothetical protein
VQWSSLPKLRGLARKLKTDRRRWQPASKTAGMGIPFLQWRQPISATITGTPGKQRVDCTVVALVFPLRAHVRDMEGKEASGDSGGDGHEEVTAREKRGAPTIRRR